MWPFPPRAKQTELQPEKLEPGISSAAELTGEVPPASVRRVEITVEREWTSTVVRKHPKADR
jgi:hypothetical protein